MWKRKTNLEHRMDQIEGQTATAVEHLADTVRQRYATEAGQQLAANLAHLAQAIDQLNLGDTMMRRRRELEHAAKKANRQMLRTLKDLEHTRGRVARDAGVLATRVGHDAGVLATRVGEQVEHGSQQLATLSQKAAPAEPRAWILPSLLGFTLGFGLGFLIARRRRKRDDDQA